MNLSECTRLQNALRELLVYNLGPKEVFWPGNLPDEPSLAINLAKENYLKVLQLGKDIIWSNLAVKHFEVEALQKYLTEYLQNSSIESHLQVAALGVASLQLFVETNFIGQPPLAWDQLVELFPPLGCLEGGEEKAKQTFIASAKSFLVLDGESFASVVRNPELLFFSKLFLESSEQVNNSFTKSFVVLWWNLRLLSIHQKILDEKSGQIYKKSLSLISAIENVVSQTEKESLQYVHYLNELAAFHEYYYDIAKTQENIEQATKLVGLDLHVTGALGKRTKYQAEHYPQMTLDVEMKPNRSNIQESLIGLTLDGLEMPHDAKLEDDLRLERIQFADKERENIPELSYTEQGLILGHFFHARRSKPEDALTHEELSPFLNILLHQTANPCWAVKMSALLQRSLLERSHTRTVERSLFQLETLAETLSNNKTQKHHRMINIYNCRWVPFWALEAQLIQLLLSMGSIKSALDRSLKIELWDSVIDCYQRLNLKHKAAEIIRQQIDEKGESAHLYCLLGDATENKEYYEKAILISNNKSSRAFRSLGLYYYFRKEYEPAIKNFKLSLEQNSFQLETLLRLGFASMQIEDWETAATTYRKYCTYESENFEAWNNLSNSYIKMGQKARAWKVLQEAAKCDYDNWKIWDNIMVVSTDCAEFEEVMRAYHRILDLKDGKHLDLEVLGILVEAINSNINDNSGVGAGKYHAPALKLFGRLTSHLVAEPKLWQLYAKLTSGAKGDPGDADGIPSDAETAYKSGQLMVKAVGAAVQKKDWNKSRESCLVTLNLASEAAEYCLAAGNFDENKAQSVPQLASLKLTLNLILSKVKATQMSLEDDEIVLEVKPSFIELQMRMEQVIAKINALKQ